RSCAHALTFIVIVLLLFFFFFQAEDGIRDFHVTGVQTCALPISSSRTRPPASPRWRSGRSRSTTPSSGRSPTTPTRPRVQASSRSEERRVGKECRSRWSPEQYKKQKRRSAPDEETYPKQETIQLT